MMYASAFTLKNVSLHYSDRFKNVLHRVSIDLPMAKTTMILGQNGSGKTTLLKIILGFLTPQEGIVTKNQDYSETSISFIPQIETPLNGLSVYDFILFGRINARNSYFSSPQKEDYEIVEQAIQDTGIFDLKNKNVAEISGGEFQKVRITRAIVQQAKSILMDEPTTFLDYKAKKDFFSIIQKLKNDCVSIVLTSHDPDEVIEHADYVILMQSDGSVIAGQPKDTMTIENLRQTFGVDVIRNNESYA